MPISNNRYVAMVCTEMPEARFEDVVTVQFPDAQQHDPVQRASVPIDSKFIEVCVPGSVVPVGGIGSSLCLIGAYIRDGLLEVEAGALPGQPPPTSVTVRLSGIRRGRDAQRFVEHTQDEMKRNQEFWDRWRSGGK
jgi:hypothetical protein